MSVTVAKADGVTVFTLTTDPQSPCPPLCQILKGLCYSPACFSVSPHMRRSHRTSQSVLGTLQIMVGLLNIGLGVILSCSHFGSSWEMDSTGFPYWIGVMFMLFGSLNILSEKYPSPCLVILNVILNLAGVGFAIAAIVLYSINLGNTWYLWMCNHDYWEVTPSTTAEERLVMEKCLEGRAVIAMLLRSINAVLIVLSVLELCVVISSAVLGIKALRSSEKKKNESTDDPELYKPLLEGVTSNSPA